MMNQLVKDLNYTEQQRAIRTMVRDFAEKEIAPGAEERDRTGEFPYDLYIRLGELGLTYMRYPKEYGGMDSDYLSFCLAAEEIARVDCSLAITLVSSVANGLELLVGATEEQKKRWMDDFILPVAQGQAIVCGAVTEPQAGSDTAGIQTYAALDGGEWVINGSKSLITNAGLKNCVCVLVLALTNRAEREFSTFMVPTGTPGYTIMPKYRKMGWRSSDTRELAFEECRVPAGNVVGVIGGGRKRIVTSAFCETRIGVATLSLGVHQACYERSLEYAKQRIAFGKPLSKFQHIQNMLVEMATDLELSRLLRDKAALLVDVADTPPMKEASMAKLYCCEVAKKAADYAIQIHGGLGYMDECPVSRYYRDVRVTTIVDGATDIQKIIIAKELGC